MTSNKKRRGTNNNKKKFRECVGPNTSAKAFCNSLKRIKNENIQNKKLNSSIDGQKRRFDCFLCCGIEKVQVKIDRKQKVSGIGCEKCKKESHVIVTNDICRPIDIYLQWKEYVEKKPFYNQVKRCIIKIMKKKLKQEKNENTKFINGLLSKQEIIKQLVQEHKSYSDIKNNKKELLNLMKDKIYPAVNLALTDNGTFKKIFIKCNNNNNVTKCNDNNNHYQIILFNLI